MIRPVRSLERFQGLLSFSKDRLPLPMAAQTSRPIPPARAKRPGSGTGVISTAHERSSNSPPVDRSATKRFQEPLGSMPENWSSRAVRGASHTAEPGSTFRPSGCQMPVSRPSRGRVWDPPSARRYPWMSDSAWSEKTTFEPRMPNPTRNARRRGPLPPQGLLRLWNQLERQNSLPGRSAPFSRGAWNRGHDLEEFALGTGLEIMFSHGIGVRNFYPWTIGRWSAKQFVSKN